MRGAGLDGAGGLSCRVAAAAAAAAAAENLPPQSAQPTAQNYSISNNARFSQTPARTLQATSAGVRPREFFAFGSAHRESRRLMAGGRRRFIDVKKDGAGGRMTCAVA